jgi:hypothetical protein
MKTFLIITLSILFLMSGCTGIRATATPANPDFVNALITKFQDAPVGNPLQSIWKYEYKGGTVYFVPPQCCDQYSQLYDASGSLICAPDGGFTGSGDGKCPDFFQTRSNGVLIWSDSRSK